MLLASDPKDWTRLHACEKSIAPIHVAMSSLPLPLPLLLSVCRYK